MRLFVEINIRGTTVVVATHDLELIRRMGKRTLTLERGRLHDPDRIREVAPIVREAPFLPQALGRRPMVRPRYVVSGGVVDRQEQPAPDRSPRSP